MHTDFQYCHTCLYFVCLFLAHLISIDNGSAKEGNLENLCPFVGPSLTRKCSKIILIFVKIEFSLLILIFLENQTYYIISNFSFDLLWEKSFKRNLFVLIFSVDHNDHPVHRRIFGLSTQTQNQGEFNSYQYWLCLKSYCHNCECFSFSRNFKILKPSGYINAKHF